MLKYYSLILTAFILLTCSSRALHADVLILANKYKVEGKLTLIASDYIEFQTSFTPGESKWIKIPKKKIYVILSDERKIIYPRDKYDENVLNYGKVPLRNEKEIKLYRQRKKETRMAQMQNEEKEKNRFKVAAVVGGLGGIMVWALLDGR